MNNQHNILINVSSVLCTNTFNNFRFYRVVALIKINCLLNLKTLAVYNPIKFSIVLF